MSTSLSVQQIKTSINGTFTYTNPLINPNPQSPGISGSLSISRTNGTGAVGLADMCHLGTHTIGGSGSVTFDLTGGGTSLLQPDGSTFDPARVLTFIVMAANGGASSFSVGGAGANAWGPLSGAVSMPIGAQGAVFDLAVSDSIGFVVNGSHKNLEIANLDGSHTFTFNLYMDGCST